MMNRRQLLKLLASGVVGSALDVDRLLWIPNTKKIFLPSDAQIVRLTSDKLFDIPYHESNGTTGTWLGITRSTEPWPWKELLKKITLDATKPLYIIVDKEKINAINKV